jgi:predicted amidohydrolase
MRRPYLVSIVVLLACAWGSGAPASGPEPASSPAPDPTSASDAAGTLIATGSGMMPATPDGWRAFSPRPESVATTSIEPGPDGYVLGAAAAGNADVYGGWTTHVSGLRGGGYYRFGARARVANVASIRESATIIFRWRGTFGDEVPPDYVWRFNKLEDGSVSFDRTLQAPAGTTAVDIELVLQWAADGQVAFDKLSLVPTAAPAARKVRVAAVQYRPSGSRSGLESVQKAVAYARGVARANHPDIIVLGELLNVIGAPGTFENKAEPIPGPSTEAVAAVARAQHVNIVFGMLEKERSQLFNTAVLIGRNGNIVGKHHKVQLPLSDAAIGITPGSTVEVFDTDFGRVGILICQDASFPEPAREAALRGAELLLVPIWGGKTTLLHARAVENGIHLAAAGYDYASEVVNPLGAVLSSVVVDRAPHAAIAEIDLSQRFHEEYLGDWRDISVKERRTDPYQYQLP